MELKFSPKEILSELNITIKLNSISKLIRETVFKQLAESIREQTKSYVTPELLLGPNCNVSVKGNKIIVTLFEENSYHGSDSTKEKSFFIYSDYLLNLLLSIYYIDKSQQVSEQVTVEYGSGWEEKEKEA